MMPKNGRTNNRIEKKAMCNLLRHRMLMQQASGASPYSDYVTEVLMLNFPTYWNDIRLYGLRHKNIVPLVDEDPMIICSLVSVGIKRKLVNNNTAYIKTNYDTKSNSKWTLDYNITNYRANARHGSGVSNAYFFIGNSNVKVCAGAGRNYELNITNADMNSHIAILKFGEFTYDGITHNFGYFINSAKVWLYNMNGQNTIVQGGIAHSIFEEDNIEVEHLVPFQLGNARTSDAVYPSIQGDQAIGTCGMIDIVSGLFFPNANTSGSFQITFTDSEGQSWSPIQPA